jgi:arylsulfatase A-like enzyme
MGQQNTRAVDYHEAANDPVFYAKNATQNSLPMMPHRLRHPLLIALFPLALATTSIAQSPDGDAAPAESSRPNILLIIVDDLGFADLGCLGSQDMQTPSIDRLMADSLRLERLYANCPVCSPTRASVLTGCYPDRVGVPGVIRTHAENSWGYFAPSTETLPERLRQLGYRTAAIGKWHLGLRPENHPNSRGFQSFRGFLGDMMDDYYNHRRHQINYMRDGREEIDPEGHATDLFSQWAVDFLGSQRRATGQGRAPWFLYLAYNAPHTPIQPPQDWLRRVKQRQPGISDKRAALVALIEHMDAGIGRVLEELRDSGEDENTVIVFTSDNGGQVNVGANNGPLRDGKQSMYEGGLRIPGCIRVPGQTSAGTASDTVCSTADFQPTLVELAGGQAQDGIDGFSLAPMLSDPNASWPAPRELYFVRREGGTRYSGLTIEALLLGDHKLVHNLPTQKLELFDLATDPGETIDLSEKQPKLLRQFVSRLQRHVQRGGTVPWQKKMD